ncbi:MAG TPA: UDP-N-acetylglucosamine 1-carboxyvinyltransferase [Syntrophomonadaceae bacterium]|nr:UDP-N-acetylglucosamine 1-carboxyvinyltransferase [Syntrophomonadaceae bacterium]
MEDKFIIEGGICLKGDVRISGSKNACLPVLAASLLTPEKCVISGIPRLADVRTMIRMLTELGVQVAVQGSQVTVQARELQKPGQLQQYARKMRASFLLMGPVLARQGKACMALPGGCAIGKRPVDLHLKGLAALGAEIRIEKGFVKATARQLQGAEIVLDFPSVGATENIMMASACARGTTTLVNAAAEPEVVDLADFLNKMGAEVTGAGTRVIRIKGNPSLHGAVHTVIPDRIEAGTYLAAAVATGGEVRLARVVPDHLRSVIEKFREAGACIEEGNDELFVSAPQELRPLDISTSPYPGFPTDMQPQFAALLTTAAGTSRITENIFENRFLYTYELVRMGASIEVTGTTAVIRGVRGLRPACVKAGDLRAGAALVIAALKAWGETEIGGVYHLDRGYEDLEEKLGGLGCRIRRVTEQAANL